VGAPSASTTALIDAEQPERFAVSDAVAGAVIPGGVVSPTVIVWVATVVFAVGVAVSVTRHVTTWVPTLSDVLPETLFPPMVALTTEPGQLSA
jgi:hypothetical protein